MGTRTSFNEDILLRNAGEFTTTARKAPLEYGSETAGLSDEQTRLVHLVRWADEDTVQAMLTIMTAVNKLTR